MSNSIAGVQIPDTRLVAEATELVREAATPLLFHHSRRVYLFGMLQVVTDDRVNFAEIESSVLLDNLFRCRTFVECVDDRVERYARIANSHDAGLID